MILCNLHPEKVYIVAEHYSEWSLTSIDVIKPVQEYYFDTVCWLEDIKMITISSKVILEHMIDIVCHKFNYVSVFDYSTLVKMSKSFSKWLAEEFRKFKPHNTLLLSQTEFSYILCMLLVVRCPHQIQEIEKDVKSFL